ELKRLPGSFFPAFGSSFRADHPALFSTPTCFFFTFSASDTSFDEPCPRSSRKHARFLTDQRPFLFSLANRALLSALPSSLRISWGAMIQEYTSKFFPTELGIRNPRPATHRTPL